MARTRIDDDVRREGAKNLLLAIRAPRKRIREAAQIAANITRRKTKEAYRIRFKSCSIERIK